MIDGSKYTGFGLGFGPHVNSVYRYYESVLEMLDLELCDEILGSKGSRNTCRSLINPYFASFQEWCRDVYEEMKADQDKAFYLFRDILIRYQLSKKNSFYEKDDKIFHILLTRPTRPISNEGDRIQQMAFVIYEYLNLAINCLEDYVTRLKSTIHEAEQNTKETGPSSLKNKSKLHGFNVKNQDCLRDAYNQLINLEIISKDVSYFDFEKVFLGHIPENKITWLKGPGLLSYFIKKINGIGIRNQKKTIWKTTISCFKDKDGIDFEVQQLRHGKVPKETDEMQMVIGTFNQDSFQEE